MTRRVLVVDDDELTRELLATILDLEEFDVELAADGETALAAIAAHPPDVVVLDVTMPGIDGLEVLRRLRGDDATARLPVILLTARDEDEDRRTGAAVGADAYLTKPFSPLSLIATIDRIAVRERGTV